MGQTFSALKFQKVKSTSISEQRVRTVSEDGTIFVTHKADEREFMIYQMDEQKISKKNILMNMNIASEILEDYREQSPSYKNHLQVSLQNSSVVLYSLDQYNKRQIGKAVINLPIADNPVTYTYFDILFSYDIQKHPSQSELIILNEGGFYALEHNLTHSFTPVDNTIIKDSKLFIGKINDKVHYYGFFLIYDTNCSYLQSFQMEQLSPFTTYGNITEKKLQLPCLTNLHFNRFDYNQNDNIFGINLQSMTDNTYYSIFLNEELQKISQNYMILSNYHFHLFSKKENIILVTELNTNNEISGSSCYIGYSINNESLEMAEMTEHCTKRNYNFDRLGELKINSTSYLFGQQGEEMKLFDKTFDQLEEVDEYENIQKSYSYIPKFHQISVKKQNRILAFAENYNQQDQNYEPKKLTEFKIIDEEIINLIPLIASFATVGAVLFVILCYCICINRKAIKQFCEENCGGDNKIENEAEEIKQITHQRIGIEELSNTFCPLCDSAQKCYFYLPCNHFFHEECILQYLEKYEKCPICKKKTKKKKVKKIKKKEKP